MIRPLLLIAAIALTACAGMDRPAMSEFEPLGNNGFRFEANADPVAYPLQSPGAEAVRMDWLETYLSDNQMCPTGYAILERKAVVTGTHLTGTGYRIYYRGRCAAHRAASTSAR